MTFSESGSRRKRCSDGTVKEITTKGYHGTAALNTLRKLLAARYLREGQGLFATPASRRNARLFGASGRVTLPKLECETDGEYDPAKDTCIRAFVRLLAARAAEAATDDGVQV